jgi:GNAT superfamily N-acetyltransferase
VPDAGNTVVDPRYRSRQLAARIGARLIDLCRELGHTGFLHYPTTAHPIMQRLAVAGGGVETGLLLQYIPATTDYRELSGESRAGRLAAVVVYQPIGAAPEREVYAPETYRTPRREHAYRRARLPRRLRAPGTRCTGVGELVHEEARAIRALIEAEGASP